MLETFINIDTFCVRMVVSVANHVDVVISDLSATVTCGQNFVDNLNCSLLSNNHTRYE
jgi:hypothetical protein